MISAKLDWCRVIVVVSVACFAATASTQAAPNVVLFLVDDMGWADWAHDTQVNPTGGRLYETPNMIALALQGVTFRQAYAASPVCTPTRSALATGMTPARNGMTQLTHKHRNWQTPTMRDTGPNGAVRWVENIPVGHTLGEVMRDAGYATGFFGKWHLGVDGNPSSDPMNLGYEVNYGGNFRGAPTPAHTIGFFAGKDGGWSGLPGLDPESLSPDKLYPPDTYLTDAVTKHVVEFISEKSASNQPFFAMVSHYDVHDPIQLPGPNQSGHKKANAFKLKNANLKSAGNYLHGHSHAGYAWKLYKMDQSLGRILDCLEDPDGDGDASDSIRDNTLVIFASDNGGFASVTSNSPLRSAKGSLYEGGIRTPLIISWTGNSRIHPGMISNELTSTEDLYTTVLDAARVSIPVAVAEQIDGISLLPALSGDGPGREFIIWHYPHLCNDKIDGRAFSSAIRLGEWKLIWFYDQERYELYNLSDDIAETQNRLKDRPGIAASLSRHLHKYLVSVNARYPIRIGEAGGEVGPPRIIDKESD